MQYKILISLQRNYVFFILQSTPAFWGKNTCIVYTPRTSEDKFLKNGEYLMSKCYLYCIDSRFFVPVL